MNRPASVWTPSPNFHPTTGRAVTCVVMHATATPSVASPKAWLCNPDSKVSAHYLIDLDGTIYQLVREENIAWHAGYSSWRGQLGVNSYSVGIEMVNLNDGAMPYPPEQREAAAALVAAICADHNIRAEDVVGHVDVADGKTPEEKAQHLKEHSDPRGFPFPEFRASLVAMGVAA